ncbi:hypothetical protein IF1G_10548 [Cordyceps javanica]|uniref:Uncharacterized protein n=1 Tax=Cordyceps javanica TaxID=43265 RepID=A0A545UMW7_9HYPO|nr:hypothetical protein IF1G_10548 [Cordyceps javanica]
MSLTLAPLPHAWGILDSNVPVAYVSHKWLTTDSVHLLLLLRSWELREPFRSRPLATCSNY